MAVDRDKLFYCERCKKTMRADQFYSSNNLEKYPEGKLNQCKQCITMHVDNWKPETFTWILEECDVPWIPEEWDKLLAKYASDPRKVTGMTIIGRYLSKMRLGQWEQYRWKDSEFLQQLSNHKIEEAMKRQGYGAAEIAQTLMENDVNNGGFTTPKIEMSDEGQATHDYFEQINNDIVIDDDLTEEDKRYLLIKWGKMYKPEEWVRLEQFYKDMMESYDIQGAGHEDNLKLVCKTSLKLHQLLDIGDVDGAQKMQKMYDGLMKSGNFTAVQNKSENGEYLNSISELAMICEREGFIPRYYADGPKDRVDETILDMKQYVHSLVVDEMNLGNLIDNAVKQMSEQEAKEEDEDIEDEDLTLEQIEALKDEDFVDFMEFEEEEKEEDSENIQAVLDNMT